MKIILHFNCNSPFANTHTLGKIYFTQTAIIHIFSKRWVWICGISSPVAGIITSRVYFIFLFECRQNDDCNSAFFFLKKNGALEPLAPDTSPSSFQEADCLYVSDLRWNEKHKRLSSRWVQTWKIEQCSSFITQRPFSASYGWISQHILYLVNVMFINRTMQKFAWRSQNICQIVCSLVKRQNELQKAGWSPDATRTTLKHCRKSPQQKHALQLQMKCLKV